MLRGTRPLTAAEHRTTDSSNCHSTVDIGFSMATVMLSDILLASLTESCVNLAGPPRHLQAVPT
jgi:hypothetical protein